MELPKNVTQIGESDRNCKIYVEDYVISYMKQMNQLAQDKTMALALYGVRKTEEGIDYLFLYGACRLLTLQREARHLSQAQMQEIEKLRKRYFPEYIFLGYRLLNGEMVEGFHICQQEICRYIGGYAQFYEKNDSMLAYMLENRNEESTPEVVDQGKYEAVRKRQEERRNKNEAGRLSKENSGRTVVNTDRRRQWESKKLQTAAVSPQGLRRMKLAVTGTFVLLCLLGLTGLREEGTGNAIQEAARQAVSSLTEQKLPDEEALKDNQTSTLIAEDKLTEAIQQENETPDASLAVETEGEAVTTTEASETPEELLQTPMPEVAPAAEPQPTAAPEEAPAVSPKAQPVSYLIQKGDTLIGICMRNYGSDEKVMEICSLNHITDPDDIKVGQEILLP